MMSEAKKMAKFDVVAINPVVVWGQSLGGSDIQPHSRTAWQLMLV